MTQKTLTKKTKVKIVSVNAPSQEALDRFTRELLQQAKKRKAIC